MPEAENVLYDKGDLELMTTYQLREICRKNKIINGVAAPLDKDELIRIILRNFGRQEEFLITESHNEGMVWSGCRRCFPHAGYWSRMGKTCGAIPFLTLTGGWQLQE